VAVDDGPVDADGLGDVVDLGVADSSFVEEGAGGGDDLVLTIASTVSRAGSAAHGE
jgi:hypothetical protein